MTMFIESGVTALANVVEQDGQGWFRGMSARRFWLAPLPASDVATD
ncbi:hypothetical protein OGM22_04940 [Dickeya fangzhongdai]|nr:hypothetical protein [Dickeya fangzhongdai]UMB78263.1 hypothetical protein FXN80_07620 [Dickeya fangzhongdai]WES87442.1 hypothetical protein PQ617_14460 [Dickeya fangzhongdai]WOY01178.1 hypothetical protein OGM22_04940 [Dickeya fangzhongdai]